MGNPMILHSKPTLDKDDFEAVISVMESCHLGQGKIVFELESLFCNYYNKKYSYAVSNGFAAIHLSLIALGVKDGDEVIIPSYTCSALLNPILLLGATPIIADIEEKSFNISIQDVLNNLSNKTKAIIVPHIFGFPAKIDEIVSLGIPVIEDCAQSLGGSYKGKLLGSFGTLGVFSFYATKMICSGNGGMIITNDLNLSQTINNYRYYGHKKLHRYVAYNYHMTNLTAALAMSQLNKLESFVERRKAIASKYDGYFSKGSRIGINFENKNDACYYRFPVKLDCNIELVKSKMQEKGIQCGFGVLDGMHQIQKLDAQYYPNTELNLQSILTLPIYPSLKNEDVYYIASKLIEVIKKV
jgi:perosamine synthetase